MLAVACGGEHDRHICDMLIIVIFAQIARSTLLRHHIRLFHFASCTPTLAHHKEAYFNLLHMLKRMRRRITTSLNESNLNGESAAMPLRGVFALTIGTLHISQSA